MAENKDEEKTTVPESPTTAKQLDFDDEPEASSTVKTTSTEAPKSEEMSAQSLKPTVEDEAPPAKPPRPTTPGQENENTLKEAFPEIDIGVIRAVLTASGGQVEPAFNALLGMSDPNFKAEEAAPPKPPRPTAAQIQLEQDEMYARQLAQQYQTSSQSQRQYPSQRQPRQQQQQQRRYNDSDELYRGDENDRNFFDDDLQEFGENVKKGFVQAQGKFNKWFGEFKKNFDGDEEDPYDGPTRQDTPPRRQNFGSSQSAQLRGIRQSADRTRKSGDYDADPHVLGDDFTGLELRDDEAPPAKPARPTANPNLFKPTPKPPQSGPVDEVDAAERRAAREDSAAPGSSSKSTKWQPLTSVAPAPEPEDDDPFSLGDSDDEKESKTKDMREADSERLKAAARESTSGGPKPELQETKRGSISTKNAEAEALLTGDVKKDKDDA